jgi:hypothetical protein
MPFYHSLTVGFGFEPALPSNSAPWRIIAHKAKATDR